MKKTRLKKSLSFILCIMLIAATAMFTTGCNDNKETSDSVVTENVAPANGSVLGEGAKIFDFTVTDAEGNETAYEIHTDKDMVGEALLELGLIDGEEGDYGLYVKTVNGITVDYDTDGKYWAFYVDGEYAMTGVDVTEITEGAAYSFKVE